MTIPLHTVLWKRSACKVQVIESALGISLHVQPRSQCNNQVYLQTHKLRLHCRMRSNYLCTPIRQCRGLTVEVVDHSQRWSSDRNPERTECNDGE